MDMFEIIQQFHHDWVTIHGVVNPNMDYPDGLDLITSPSKLDSFLWLAAREEVRGLKYEKD